MVCIIYYFLISWFIIISKVYVCIKCTYIPISVLALTKRRKCSLLKKEKVDFDGKGNRSFILMIKVK